jgi:hypothetical protein
MDKEAETNLGLLKDEYLMVQEFYQDIDRRCFTIMGWSITVAVTAIGAGIVYGQSILLLVAFLAALTFWYLEASWRGLSYFMSHRILQIERAISDGTVSNLKPMQLYSEWDREFEKSGRQTRNYFFKLQTAMPHILIALISLALFLAVFVGWIELIPYTG